ncbi:MAG: hypothetical protein MK078_15360 [Crocinitomicaceae bacterium]|nr:hypothetical protein [Crocinitomicaceae bacterium]
MYNRLTLLLLLFILVSNSFALEAPTDTLLSVVIDKSDSRFQSSLEEYHKSDEWKIWSVPIGTLSTRVTSTGSLKDQGKITFIVDNLEDLNLKTAWIGEKTRNPIGQKFSFEFFIHPESCFGCPTTFYGVINLFNGYCQSNKTWKNYSRVKSMKVLYNDSLLCMVGLKDTWQMQTIDLSRYFENQYSNKKKLQKLINVKTGDVLRFEITAIYPGEQYKNVAISEFVAEGAKN